MAQLAQGRVFGIVLGILLILVPFAAYVMRLLNSGWGVFVLIIASFILIPAWIFQAVIATIGYLIPKPAFLAPGANRIRSTIAALGASILPFAASFLMWDGGDGPEWSPLQIVAGGSLPEGWYEATVQLSYLFALLTIVFFIWLVVEWIIALRHKSAAKVAAAQAVPQTVAG